MFTNLPPKIAKTPRQYWATDLAAERGPPLPPGGTNSPDLTASVTVLAALMDWMKVSCFLLQSDLFLAAAAFWRKIIGA